MSEQLRLTLLGGLRVELEGSIVNDFTSKKSLALLTYLAMTGRAHSREALSALLWSESGTAQARASLRTVLWDLRQQLPSYVAADRQTISLDQGPACWVDALVLTRTIESVLGLSQVSSRQDEDRALLADEQVGALEEALSLYHGDFMAGFFVSDAPEFEDWMLKQREATRQLVLQALHRLLRHYRTSRAYRSATDVATRLLDVAPWQEETHRELMRLHVLDGQRSAALVQYQTCRQMLEEELGVEPTLETRLLYRRIKAGRPLDEERTESWPSGFNVNPECLGPRAGTPAFVGRDDETVALKQMLSAPDGRLVTLVGAAGAGKTRLAWATAHQVARSFDDGVWFISLRSEDTDRVPPAGATEQLESPTGPAPEPELVLRISRALGVSTSALSPARQQILDYLSQREALLVLDDFGASPARLALIREMLDRAPYLRLLVIAEEPLDIESQQTLHLDGLSLPPPTTGESLAWERPQELIVYDSVRLFVERAARSSPGFELTRATARHVAQICRMGAGFPLCIELAAAHVGGSAPAEVARNIEYHLKDLRGVSGDCGDAQRSLRASFSYSLDRLSSSERLALSRLAIFHAPFTDQAASDVVEVSSAVLKSLTRKGLLFRRASDRFDWHPAIRRLALGVFRKPAFDSEAWDYPLDSSAFQVRYRRHYLGLLARLAPALRGPGARAASAEIHCDWRHVRRAWYWALAEADVEWLGRSLAGLSLFLSLQGWNQEGVQLLEAAVCALHARARAGEGPAESALVVRLSIELAGLLNAHGAPERACRTAREVVELVRTRAPGSAALLCWLAAEAAGHRDLGFALHRQGQVQLARDRLGYALSLTEDGSCPEIRASVLTHLGVVEMDGGDLFQAREHLDEALALYEELGDDRGRSRALNELVLVLTRRSNHSSARTCARESLNLAQTRGDRALQSAAYANLGRIAAAREDYRAAIAHGEHALRIARDLGDPLARARALSGLALAHLRERRKEAAWRRSLLAVELARSAAHRAIEARALLIAGHAFTELDMMDQAVKAYQQARQLQSALGQSDQLVESAAGLARARLGQGDTEEARVLVEEVLSRLEEGGLGDVSQPMRVYLACYQVLKANGDPRARDLLARASGLYEGMPPSDAPSADT